MSYAYIHDRNLTAAVPREKSSAPPISVVKRQQPEPQQARALHHARQAMPAATAVKSDLPYYPVDRHIAPYSIPTESSRTTAAIVSGRRAEAVPPPTLIPPPAPAAAASSHYLTREEHVSPTHHRNWMKASSSSTASPYFPGATQDDGSPTLRDDRRVKRGPGAAAAAAGGGGLRSSTRSAHSYTMALKAQWVAVVRAVKREQSPPRARGEESQQQQQQAAIPLSVESLEKELQNVLSAIARDAMDAAAESTDLLPLLLALSIAPVPTNHSQVVSLEALCRVLSSLVRLPDGFRALDSFLQQHRVLAALEVAMTNAETAAITTGLLELLVVMTTYSSHCTIQLLGHPSLLQRIVDLLRISFPPQAFCIATIFEQVLRHAGGQDGGMILCSVHAHQQVICYLRNVAPKLSGRGSRRNMNGTAASMTDSASETTTGANNPHQAVLDVAAGMMARVLIRLVSAAPASFASLSLLKPLRQTLWQCLMSASIDVATMACILCATLCRSLQAYNTNTSLQFIESLLLPSSAAESLPTSSVSHYENNIGDGEVVDRLWSPASRSSPPSHVEDEEEERSTMTTKRVTDESSDALSRFSSPSTHHNHHSSNRFDALAVAMPQEWHRTLLGKRPPRSAQTHFLLESDHSLLTALTELLCSASTQLSASAAHAILTFVKCSVLSKPTIQALTRELFQPGPLHAILTTITERGVTDPKDPIGSRLCSAETAVACSLLLSCGDKRARTAFADSIRGRLSAVTVSEILQCVKGLLLEDLAPSYFEHASWAGVLHAVQRHHTCHPFGDASNLATSPKARTQRNDATSHLQEESVLSPLPMMFFHSLQKSLEESQKSYSSSAAGAGDYTSQQLVPPKPGKPSLLFGGETHSSFTTTLTRGEPGASVVHNSVFVRQSMDVIVRLSMHYKDPKRRSLSAQRGEDQRNRSLSVSSQESSTMLRQQPQQQGSSLLLQGGRSHSARPSTSDSSSTTIATTTKTQQRNPWSLANKHDVDRAWTVSELQRRDLFLFFVPFEQLAEGLSEVLDELTRHIAQLGHELRLTSMSQPMRRCVLRDLYLNAYPTLASCVEYLLQESTACEVAQLVYDGAGGISSGNVLEVYHAVGAMRSSQA